jgi:flagellar biosynthesis protein FlhB
VAENVGEKIHPATPHRRQEARRQGEYPRSSDLASAGILLASLAALYLLGHACVDQILLIMSWQLRSGGLELHATDQLIHHVEGLLATCLHLLAPVLGLLFLAAFLSHWSQVGYSILPQRLAPRLSHIAPGAGFGRLCSLTTGVRLLTGILKLLVVTAILGFQFHRHQEEILHSFQYPLPRWLEFLVEILFGTALQVALGFTFLALLDYGYQYWRHEQSLRMTDQELREELRTLQGDPFLPRRRRALRCAPRTIAAPPPAHGRSGGSLPSSTVS